MDKMHEAKLYIINNPGCCKKAVAADVGCCLATVTQAFIELNIQQSKKPEHYVG